MSVCCVACSSCSKSVFEFRLDPLSSHCRNFCFSVFNFFLSVCLSIYFYLSISLFIYLYLFIYLTGEDIENRYKLSGYGIPLDQLPITETGKIKVMHFKKWLQLRKNIEDPNYKLRKELESIVECPRLNDVVFRPSQSTMCHPGNVMFRGLVESKHVEHSVAPSREAKIDVTRSVMTAVRNLGGRFLVWNNQTWWTELTDERIIYSKIAVFFRNSKVSAKAKTNRQVTRSSTFIFADQTSSMNDKRRRIDLFGSGGSSNSSGDDRPCFGVR